MSAVLRRPLHLASRNRLTRSPATALTHRAAGALPLSGVVRRWLSVSGSSGWKTAPPRDSSRSTGSGDLPQYSSEFSPHTVMAFTYQNTDFYVVGTAHISARSAHEVADVIDKVQPHAIMIELDAERVERMTKRQADTKPPKAPSVMTLLGRLLSARTGGDVFGQLLRMIYEYLAAKGFNPGAEFMTAIREGDARGIPVIYGDQNSRDTMRNIASNISLPDLLQKLMNPQYQLKLLQAFQQIERKLATYNAANPNERLRLSDGRPRPPPSGKEEEALLEGLVTLAEAMKNRETARMLVAMMNEQVPELCQALIFDRDVYLWNSLAKLADPNAFSGVALRDGQRRVVVGVVGFGHLDGIEKEFRKAQARNKVDAGGSGSGRKRVETGSDKPIRLPANDTPTVIHL